MPIQKITETETSSSPSPDTHFLVTQPETDEAGKIIESLRRIGADDIADMLKEKFGLGDTAKELASLKQIKVDKPSATDDGKIPRAKEGGVEWVEVGQPTDDQTDGAVTKWLDKHPEATTTVQDGAISEKKIEVSFLPWIKKEYVTPQMFGAVGDGVTDDSEALQKMFNANRTIFAIDKTKKYLITKTINILSNQHDITLLGMIHYIGDKYAFNFTCDSTADGKKKGRVSGNIAFGSIYADNGGCLAFYPKNGNYGYVSDMQLTAKKLNCKTNCIYVYSTGWLNENVIREINFLGGMHAFYCEMLEGAEISRLTFDRCHIEGPTNGIYINTNGNTTNDIKLFDCRTNEPIDGYYMKIDNQNSQWGPLITSKVEIYGNMMRSKFIGDAIYHCHEVTPYVDVGDSREIYLNALLYQGRFINPPFNTSNFKGFNIPASESEDIIVDLSNSDTYPVLLRSNYPSASVLMTVAALPFSWEYVIPIKTWHGIKFTIKVSTKVGEKSAIIENSNNSTIYYLHVNYLIGDVYIK